MSSPGSKRPFEATIEEPSFTTISHTQPFIPPSTSITSESAPQQNESSSRASTPLSSVPDNTSTRPSSPPSGAKEPAAPMENPAKKQKLTFAEKESIRLEKEIRARQKAEEKMRKEAEREAEKEAKKEEKRTKAEEHEQKKREREHEREEKRRQQEEAKEERKKVKEAKDAAKEADNAAKEAEKKAKEEEKAKKERSQMRLNVFFTKPSAKAASATSSRRSSIASLKEGSPAKPPPTALPEVSEDQSSAYDKLFPAFFLHTHTTIAPINRYECDADSLAHACSQIDDGLGNPRSDINSTDSLKRSLQGCSHEPYPKRRKFGSCIVPVRDLVSKINGTATTPIDLTVTEESTARDALEALSKIRVKYLRYAEDVRPPYVGTFTKIPEKSRFSQLCRNPFARTLEEVDYDYDSEAEWEEPEEGEDLNSDDDEEEADEDDADMDGFLDDEDDAGGAPKRRNLMGDMEPMVTALFWQAGSVGHSGATDVPFGPATLDLSQFRIAPLLVEAVGPIDPFSSKYWAPPSLATPDTSAASMAPPQIRVPLNTLHGPNNPPLAVNALAGLGVKQQSTAGPGSKNKVAVKPFPPELLADFRREIDGSDLSKIGLIEVLKKKFPQVTGKMVSETLPLVAKRDGKTVSEKKWVLL